MHESFGLPRPLADGLLLRWATSDDIDALAEFNLQVHSDDPGQPDVWLAHWTQDLMGGAHPTTRASDFTLVVDQHKGDRIVSTLALVSQEWLYEGIPFAVGTPELVGTHEDYRRRGLVRAQMNAIHEKSAARGEQVQAIAGIPWYYRQFGYEMAMDLGGERVFYWNRPGNYEPAEEEQFCIRRATLDDIPHLLELYPRHCADSPVVRKRDEPILAYELAGAHESSEWRRNLHMVTTQEKEIVGYVEYEHRRSAFHVREVGVARGQSWRAVGLFLTRHLKREADELNRERNPLIDHVMFRLGGDHPLYRALGRQTDLHRPPYAWYLRVPDLPGFLQHISPALERRLADSVMAGHTGTVRLELFTSQIALVWERGKLAEVGTYTAKNAGDGDAVFPDLTFLKLLFGHRSLAELDYARADCYANVEAAILLDILFPRRPAHLVLLG
jgi:hypothetical protein